MKDHPDKNRMSRLAATATVVVLGVLLTTGFFQTCLADWDLAKNFMSPKTWLDFATGGRGAAAPAANTIDVTFAAVFVPCLVISLLTWIGGAALLAWRRQTTLSESLILWGWYGWIWWCVLDVWEWLRVAASISGFVTIWQFLSVFPQFWLAGCLACWMTTWLVQARPAAESTSSNTYWLWLSCGIYSVVFTAMNWRLYWNLLVPHGDSAMYEEHLWNVVHGKGFLSYLDQGSFLGEHIQFVHLFLIPLYILWPSHLLLEACSSTALAFGAFPVYWMVQRHTGSTRTALAVSIAYLLYFPMQFLDIEIDLKTFRPESFGIPLLLLTLDQVDRRHLWGTCLGIAACLTVKEDYAIIFGPLGVWIAFCGASTPFGRLTGISTPDRFANFRVRLVFGLSVSIFSVAYLWLATRVIMRWFRSGVEVHYASYFARFGKSPEEILHTMMTQPGLLFESLFTMETALYAIALLAPLAFLPLLSLDRLAVGLPLFGILCLNELEGSKTPQHQFHAPLVAIVFWALAAAMPRADAFLKRLSKRWHEKMSDDAELRASIFRHLVWTSSLACGLFFSLGPLGILFWDANSSWSWRKLYAPQRRAEMFARMADLIPQTARVASTDFVHPRYTHFERSYDYSNYQRKVSGEGNRVPDDTDYVVIDTDHRYSEIKKPSEVPELRDHPERWELLPDQTEGVFIVLKRKQDGH